MVGVIVAIISSVIASVIGLLAIKHQRRGNEIAIKNSPTRLVVVPGIALPGPIDEMIFQTKHSVHLEHAMCNLKTYLGIKVTNDSLFPVTLKAVGFKNELHGEDKLMDPDEIGMWQNGFYKSRESFPVELAPDQTCEVYERVTIGRTDKIELVAFAMTQDGIRFEGTSEIMPFLKSRELHVA